MILGLVLHVKKDDRTEYQCKRKASLFKTIYDDGRIEYRDRDREKCDQHRHKHLAPDRIAEPEHK